MEPTIVPDVTVKFKFGIKIPPIIRLEKQKAKIVKESFGKI